MDRVRRNEVSVPLNIGEETILFDPHYDTVQVFRWLGHSIIRLITDEGLAQIHLTQEMGERVAKAAGCEIFYREEIGEREYEKYLEAQETQMERWLED